MKENRHSRSIPKGTIAQVQAKIREAHELLKPYMLAITPTEKLKLPKMGPKTLSFVEKCHLYAHENPNIVPPYLILENFDIDFADARDLWVLYNSVVQLEEGLADTQTISGSEAYRHSLIFYGAAKKAAEQNIPGAQAIYEELKVRFPRTKKQQKNAPAE